MNIDYQWIQAWVTAHADILLTWLGAGLIVLVLARIQFVLLSRKAARAMSTSVATTVAACVPEIAAAARTGTVVAGPHEPAFGGADLAGLRADTLRRVALDTVATINSRARRLDELGNLRLPDDALTRIPGAGPADPLLVVAPQPMVQAALAAQRVFDDQSQRLQERRREAQLADDAYRQASEELRQARAASAAITARFEQASGQTDRADLQRLLIQEYNALGMREAAAVERQLQLKQAAVALDDDLRRQASEAVQAYHTSVAPLMSQLRAAWGHGEPADALTTWMGDATDSREVAPAPRETPAVPTVH